MSRTARRDVLERKITGQFAQLVLPVGIEGNILSTNTTASLSITAVLIPEPGSTALAILGLLSLSVYAQRRRKRA